MAKRRRAKSVVVAPAPVQPALESVVTKSESPPSFKISNRVKHYEGDTAPYSWWTIPAEKRLVIRAYVRASVSIHRGGKVSTREVISRCQEDWGDGVLGFKDKKKILALLDELEQDGWIIRCYDRKQKPRANHLGAEQSTSVEASATGDTSKHTGTAGTADGNSARPKRKSQSESDDGRSASPAQCTTNITRASAPGADAELEHRNQDGRDIPRRKNARPKPSALDVANPRQEREKLVSGVAYEWEPLANDGVGRAIRIS